MYRYVRFCRESWTILHSIVVMFYAYAIVIIMVWQYYYLLYNIIVVNIAYADDIIFTGVKKGDTANCNKCPT